MENSTGTMASQLNYRRSINRSYHSLASISSPNPGQMYTRDIGPQSADFLPRPVEMDLGSSRTLPNPSVSASIQWESAYSSPGFGDMPYGASSIPRMSTIPSDAQNRGPSENPLHQWYLGNDGPWAPFPRVGIDSVTDDRLLPMQTSNRNIPYSGQSGQCRQQNPSDITSFPFGVTHSDSGYGTRRSVGNTSVFSADLYDRDQNSHSMAGPHHDFQASFHGYNEASQRRDSIAVGTWTPSASHPSESPRLVCPTCNKSVKTQSELKKHDLRHRKPYVCEVANCSRREGFSTTNDLERHTKSKHPSSITENASTRMFRCLVPGCKSKDKSWPRLDNFRSHLKRVHMTYFSSDREFENMIRRAEFWERTGSILEPEVISQRNILLEVTRPASPVQRSLPRELDWKAQYPEAVKQPEDSTSADEISPQTEEYLPTTVQPVEVFPVPAHIPESRMTLDNLLSPNKIGSSLNETEHARPHFSAKVGSQGKALRHAVSARDATLTDVIQKALARANVSDASTEHIRNQDTERSSPPIGKISPSISQDLEDQKKAVEVLTIIRNLGYTVSKDTTHAPKVQNPGSAASNKSENQVTCGICHKFRGRPCELRKHMKRHERPYGCTFLTCNKYFGSKNDWKRHENSQHFHLETWRCDEKRPEGGFCAKVCYRRQTFQEHLKKEHTITGLELLKRKINACRIGRNCQARFWCGFCKKLIDLEKKGLDAWTERFDHIDNHFMGRAPFPRQSIHDWVLLDRDRPEGDFEIPHALGSGSPQTESEGSPAGNRYSPTSEGQSSDCPIVLEGGTWSRKRPASDGIQTDKPAKQPRNYKDYETRVYCCQCKEPYNLRYVQSCTSCADAHPCCDACEKEAVSIVDETPDLPRAGPGWL